MVDRSGRKMGKMNWIACDADNPPPVYTTMFVWKPEKRYPNGLIHPAIAIWVDEDYRNVGEPGEDFMHYVIVDAPDKESVGD